MDGTEDEGTSIKHDVYEIKEAPLRDYVSAQWREPYTVFA